MVRRRLLNPSPLESVSFCAPLCETNHKDPSAADLSSSEMLPVMAKASFCPSPSKSLPEKSIRSVIPIPIPASFMSICLRSGFFFFGFSLGFEEELSFFLLFYPMTRMFPDRDFRMYRSELFFSDGLHPQRLTDIMMITAVMIFLDIFIRILHRFYRMILHVMGPLDVCTERSQRQSGEQKPQHIDHK